MRYGPWLRRQLDANDVSQLDLAKQMGLDPSYVSKIVRGKVNLPGKPFRDRVNELLGIDPNDPEYLSTLPIDARILEVTPSDRPLDLSTGQLLDRALIYATDHEREIVEAFVDTLDRLFPTRQEEE